MVLFLASSASSSSVHPLTTFPSTFIFFWITTLFVALSSLTGKGTTYHALAFSFYNNNDRTNNKNTNNSNNRLFFFSTSNNAATATAVMTPSSVQYNKQDKQQHNTICMAKKESESENENKEEDEEQVFLFEEDDMEGTFAKLPESDIPVAFIDPSVLKKQTKKSDSNNKATAAAAQDGDPETKFIECYIDAVATLTSLKGGNKQKTEYYIGTPCDYSVTLCYFDETTGALQPVEDVRDEGDSNNNNNQLMDEIFPIAAGIVEEEFGDELGLVRTPQTLTLVGELELDDDDDDDDNFDPSTSQGDDDEEEVEILLTFDHDGVEYNLVRLLDPVLLVAKGIGGDNRKILLTEEESEEIMPYIEEMILDYQEDWM